MRAVRASGVIGARLLLLGAFLGGGAPVAQGPGQALGAGTDTPDVGVESQVELQDLRQRIQGMEGKLRESAAARKAADQARMEAERHLAEAAQDMARLKAEVNLLRDANLALEMRLERAQRDAQPAALGLVAGEVPVRRPDEAREVQTAQQTAPGRQADPPSWPQEREGEAGRERLRTLTQEQSALRRSLAEREADLKRAQLELRAVQAEFEALRRQQDLPCLTAPAEPPADLRDGPNLAQAMAAAEAAAQGLRKALVEAQSSRAAEARRAIREAASELQYRQLRVAGLLGARGVYRVAPGDTHASIAGRVYGDGRRWSEIAEANRGVAPDHLVPGLTLVIP